MAVIHIQIVIIHLCNQRSLIISYVRGSAKYISMNLSLHANDRNCLSSAKRIY